MTRECVQKIINSELLSGRRYRELSSWCPPVAEDFYKEAGRVSEDFITRDVLLELEIDICDHPEIFSAGNVKRWRAMDPQTLKHVINTGRRFAVTHPWKLADLKWAAQFAPLLSAALGSVNCDVTALEDVDCLRTDTSLAPG